MKKPQAAKATGMTPSDPSWTSSTTETGVLLESTGYVTRDSNPSRQDQTSCSL